MSFLWNSTTRSANAAENLLAQTNATTESRKTRVEKVLPATIKMIISMLQKTAQTELKDTHMKINLSQLFNTTTPLTTTFTGNDPHSPKPTDEELKELASLIRIELEEPTKYGLVAREIENADEVVMDIDWSKPIVPPEPVAEPVAEATAEAEKRIN